MLIVKIKGGLGNQLFQYAFGRLLSIKKNIPVKYDILSVNQKDIHRDFKLDKFNTKVVLASLEEINKNKYPFGLISKIRRWTKQKIFRNHNIGYSEKILDSKEKYFEGYWQSYKYLDPIKDKLLEEITLKNPIDQKFSDIINKINQTNSVSVHIRRGDYVNDPKTKAIHCTFGLEYYVKAFEIIKTKVQNPFLFVFSDDIEWVKENLKTDLPIFYVSDPNMPDFENFIIATYCKHHIIANSSFSFWIAWLNQKLNKIVIAPKKWSNLYQKEYKGICPEDWIRI